LRFRNFIFNKSNTHQALWIVLGSLSTLGITLISVAILSRYFSKTEYGTYKQIIYVYDTLLIVFTAGLPRVFNYYLPRYNLSQGKEIVFKITNVLFLTGLAFSLFLFAFSGVIADILKNPELARGLKYFSPVPMLLLPTLGIEGIFSTYKKNVYIAIYDTISRTLMLFCIVVPVIIFTKTYITAIYGWIASSAIILIIAYYFKGIPFRGVVSEKSDLHLKEVLKFSLPLVSASIAGMVYRAANQFYISRYFGPEVFAEFSNGFMQIPFIGMITGATTTVLMPLFSKIIYEKSDFSQITNLWHSALQKSAVLIYPMVIFFLFYSEKVVTLVYSDLYAASAKYFTTAIVLNFFNIIVFIPLLISLGETKFYARLNYGLAISLWLTDFLIILITHNPLSIAISSVVIDVVGIVVSLAFSAKKMGIPFFKLFPAGRFFVIAMHSIISLFLINILMKLFLPAAGRILYLSVAGAGYLGLLIVTAKWFKISYRDIVIPLFKNRHADSQ
jgi:O-antigen/teichoic acid export membrane protein